MSWTGYWRNIDDAKRMRLHLKRLAMAQASGDVKREQDAAKRLAELGVREGIRR